MRVLAHLCGPHGLRHHQRAALRVASVRAALWFPSFTAVLLPLFGVLAVGLPTRAAVPVSGVLSAPGTAIAWSGVPFTDTAYDPSECTALNCDTFYFTLNAPAGFFALHPNHEVQIRIAWPEASNEFDLYLSDASGARLASSVESLGSYQEINAGPLANGTYKVVIVAAQTLNASYQGSAVLAQDPVVADGKARYQPGEMVFGAPLKLPRPANPASSPSPSPVDQNLKPRVVHDPLGNLYVAAVRGVVGAVDIWKSYDTGKTFTYLGAPEGFQDVATRAASGDGDGRGQQDLAVGVSGNIYMNLLWQGSTTQASSFNGGNSWVVNPLSTDIPAGSRQWIAAAASNTVYLAYEQRESLLGGTEVLRLAVAKSTDGGVTFPHITQLAASDQGIPPGELGNLVVDPTNGNVYNVFLDRSGSRIYVARSTDDGETFDLLLIHQGLAAAVSSQAFPAIAVDGGGNLHVVFSDGVNTYLTTSQNAGLSWSHAIRINNGAATRTAIQPWVMAGDAGKVDITWLGSSSRSSVDPSAAWQIFMAQSQDDLAAVPSFAQTAVTGVILTGGVCLGGRDCAPGTRTLAEYWAPDVYLDGNALIAYPDDKNSEAPSGMARTWFVRQTAGTTIIQTVR